MTISSGPFPSHLIYTVTYCYPCDVIFFLFVIKVADGELTDFHQVLCTLEFLNKMRPLQRILREKMPTTRRGNVLV